MGATTTNKQAFQNVLEGPRCLLMDNVLTETCTHKNNPTGTALATVASDIACSPIDPLGATYATLSQSYPIDKLFLMRQTFTKYTAFAAGDYLVADSTTYAIKAVHPWPFQGSLDMYYHVILEQQSGS